MGRSINLFGDYDFKEQLGKETNSLLTIDEKIFHNSYNDINTVNIDSVKEAEKNEEKMETALNFLKLGVNEEIIARGIGLNVEKIFELKTMLG